MKQRYVPGFKKGHLTVVGRDRQKLHVRCECGTVKPMDVSNFARPKIVGCGCAQKEAASRFVRENLRREPVDLTGRQFGQLTVLGFSHVSAHRVRHWNVRCACGERRVAQGGALQSGIVVSCGCAKPQRARALADRKRAAKYPGLTPAEAKVAYQSSERYKEVKRIAMAKYSRSPKGKAWARKGSAKRRSRLIGEVSARDWQLLREAYNGCCAYCECVATAPHQDHVVALALGGAHSIENVAPACARCNHKKWAHNLVDALGMLGISQQRFAARRTEALHRAFGDRA